MGLVRLVRQDGCLPVPMPVCVPAPQSPLGDYKAAKAEAVNAFTMAYVHEVLAQTKGNVSEAARISGLSRVPLQKILARTGESAARYRDRD